MKDHKNALQSTNADRQTSTNNRRKNVASWLAIGYDDMAVADGGDGGG